MDDAMGNLDKLERMNDLKETLTGVKQDKGCCP